MPQIPHFDDEEINLHPSGAAQVSPAAMGAPGEALSRNADQVGDQMAAFLSRYTEARRAADAAHLSATAVGAMDDIQHKWSLVPDRAQAQAGFDTDTAAARKTLLAGINDPLVQSRVAQTFDSEAATRRHDTANTAFQLESSSRQAQLSGDLNTLANSAAAAKDDATRARIADGATNSIQSYVTAGWLRPEAGEAMTLKFKSDIQEVAARGLTNSIIDAQDGDGAATLAHRLSDPEQFKGLLPERREILQQRLESLSYRLDQRAAAVVAHQDAAADKNLRRSQAVNEAVLLGRIANGGTVSDSQIERMAQNQQITAGGVEALVAANKRSEDGQDNPQAALQLWHAIGAKTASSDMIFDALKAGNVSKSTSVSMMRALDTASSKAADAVARNDFAQIKTALNGGAVEAGIIPDKAPQAALWAQAQGEWHRRVGAGEDPAAVKNDMLTRYSHDTASPTWLDQPKLGVVQSAQDLAAVAARTGQAFKAGKISQPDYTAQLQLLSRYKQFYGLQAPKPAAPKPAGGKP